jgi:hypothetical protein
VGAKAPLFINCQLTVYTLQQILDRVGSQARPLLLSVTYTTVGEHILLVGGLTHTTTPLLRISVLTACTYLCGHSEQGLVDYLS